MSHTHKQPSAALQHESVKAGHELTDVSLRGVVIMGIVLVVAVIVISIGLGLLHGQIIARDARTDPEASPLAEQREPPPGPGFEETPGVQLAGYLAEQNHRRDHYGWDSGGARMPIAEAMKLYVKEVSDGRGGSTPNAEGQAPSGTTPASQKAAAANAPAGETTKSIPESQLVPGSSEGQSPKAEQGQEIPDSAAEPVPAPDDRGAENAPAPGAESPAVQP